MGQDLGGELNSLGQRVGVRVQAWKAPPPPPRQVLAGRFCRLEPLDVARHGAALQAAHALDTDGRNWTWLPYGPFDTPADYVAWLEQQARSSDPLFFAVVMPGGAAGVAAYLRIDPGHGCIEVGHIHWSPRLQRAPAATEAMYLMMRLVFELGYRRYEWKCNAFNAPSRAAAQRLGFSYEGLFRQAGVVKGRNRDTAWYSILDSEWPALRAAYERWLEPGNFDEQERQRSSLSALTRPLLAQQG
jgi:RimJ/RimL family protein N-acetyltransferase